MKKVGCLYRVSTKKQTYNNDIPVQKKACRNFINTKDEWKLTKEYMELGVSGYKLGEKERDVLQNIKQDVLNHEIEVLLVFMFDRLGRREDETPFIVKWLIDNGVEVWSVNEGQRKIENNYDKLLNFITYWQAEGESEKISLRAREKRVQLTKEGIYLGNYAPYGYEMVDSDIYTKIGKRRRILSIFEKEAKIIRLIFDLIVDKEYGVDKVAIYLNQHNIKRRKEGTYWNSHMILEIVRNPIYKGYVSFGKRRRNRDGNIRKSRDTWIIADNKNEKIAIIADEKWEKANELIDSRSRKGDRLIRLLSGHTRCGYCGDFIVPKGKDKYCYMLCKGKQKTGYCEYNKNYRVDILEKIVTNEIKTYLDTYKKIDFKNEIIKRAKRIKRREEKIKLINQKISYSQNRLVELKENIVKVLMSGIQADNEKASYEFNNELKHLDTLNEQLKKIKEEINTNDQEINQLNQYIPEWSKEFIKSSLETKRMILDKLIDKVYLYNEKIEIIVKYPIDKILVKDNV